MKEISKPAALNPDRITDTIKLLQKRINERFPSTGLSNVCSQLYAVSKQAEERAVWIARPIVALRLAAGLLISCVLLGLPLAFVFLKKPAAPFDFAQFVQIFESAINDVILIGAAVFFLATIETRVKRQRALKALHELRSLAHIVDMHQLTKDPERTLSKTERTPSSPTRQMTAFQLGRYLDYCSEMLALISKIAAVYAQDFDDPVVLAAASDIQNLSNGLSNKIWQKLNVLHTLED